MHQKNMKFIFRLVCLCFLHSSFVLSVENGLLEEKPLEDPLEELCVFFQKKLESKSYIKLNKRLALFEAILNKYQRVGRVRIKAQLSRKMPELVFLMKHDLIHIIKHLENDLNLQQQEFLLELGRQLDSAIANDRINIITYKEFYTRLLIFLDLQLQPLIGSHYPWIPEVEKENFANSIKSCKNCSIDVARPFYYDHHGSAVSEIVIGDDRVFVYNGLPQFFNDRRFFEFFYVSKKGNVSLKIFRRGAINSRPYNVIAVCMDPPSLNGHGRFYNRSRMDFAQHDCQHTDTIESLYDSYHDWTQQFSHVIDFLNENELLELFFYYLSHEFNNSGDFKTSSLPTIKKLALENYYSFINNNLFSRTISSHLPEHIKIHLINKYRFDAPIYLLCLYPNIVFDFDIINEGKFLLEANLIIENGSAYYNICTLNGESENKAREEVDFRLYHYIGYIDAGKHLKQLGTRYLAPAVQLDFDMSGFSAVVFNRTLVEIGRGYSRFLQDASEIVLHTKDFEPHQVARALKLYNLLNHLNADYDIVAFLLLLDDVVFNEEVDLDCFDVEALRDFSMLLRESDDEQQALSVLNEILSCIAKKDFKSLQKMLNAR